MLDYEAGPGSDGHDRRGGAASPAGPGRTEALIALVERHLAIDGGQREAWAELAGTMRDCVEAMRIAWAGLERSDGRGIARFDRLADVADVVSAAARRLRPALEALYPTLDAAQRQALDRLIDELIGRGPPAAARAWQ